jgi:hypothetical protein
LIATPTFAQSVEIAETFGDYQIMRVAESKVCFAVYNGKSADGSDVTYATYKTKKGDRWQIVGYVDDEKVKANGDLLTIRFDGKLSSARAVDISRGDFALPFTEDKDLADFDAGVATADEVTFKLKNLNDIITVALPALRTAKASVDTCLESIK